MASIIKIFPGLFAGTCRVMVRRHDRFRTVGLDTVLREVEQGGQCVHSVAQLQPPLQPHTELPAHIANDRPRPARARRLAVRARAHPRPVRPARRPRPAPARPARARPARPAGRSAARHARGARRPVADSPRDADQEGSELRIKCQFCLVVNKDVICTYFTF